jgi:magnesium transporter
VSAEPSRWVDLLTGRVTGQVAEQVAERLRHALHRLRELGEDWAAPPRGVSARELPPVPARRPVRAWGRGAGPGLDVVIGDCGVYERGRRRPGRVSLGEAGKVARRRGGFVWIGLHRAGDDDIAAVAAEFELPPLAVEDAVKAHQRPKVEVYDEVVFMVLKPVAYVDHDEVIDVSELAVFVGPSFVVTVRHGDSQVLTQVRAQLDAGDEQLMLHGPVGVLYRVADLVVDGYEAAVMRINDDVDQIESEVFGDDDRDHSERVYKLKREVAEFRRAVGPLAPALQRLADGAVPGIDSQAAVYFRDVHDHVLRTADAIDGHDRLLSDVLTADLARASARQSRIALEQNAISVRQNEDMRRISAWAAIGLVPTAIAGVYGMNFDNIPELHWRYGYFIVLGLIAGVCVGLHRLFHRNGWL